MYFGRGAMKIVVICYFLGFSKFFGRGGWVREGRRVGEGKRVF